jgi:hypothetical protein
LVPVNSIQFQSVPVDSSPFQLILANFGSFQSISLHSCPFQSVPVHSLHSSPFQPIPICSSPFQSIPVCSIPFQSIPVHSCPFQFIPIYSNPFQSLLIIFKNHLESPPLSRVSKSCTSAYLWDLSLYIACISIPCDLCLRLVPVRYRRIPERSCRIQSLLAGPENSPLQASSESRPYTSCLISTPDVRFYNYSNTYT